MRGQGRSRPRFLHPLPRCVRPPPGPKRSSPRVSPSAAFLAVLFLGAASACMDLNVTNPNEPDYKRALSNAGDVEALIAASYHSWFYATQQTDPQNSANRGAPALFLVAAALQNTPPWSNYGLDYYGRIPRLAINTDVTWGLYPNQTFAWEGCYQALSALANGLTALEDPDVERLIPEGDRVRDRAYARFVQGLAHGTIALLYARGFIVDETVDLTVPQDPVDYQTLMARALAYFDDAIDLASSADFAIPFEWMRASLDADGLARLARSYQARLRAQVARTPAERDAVDWAAVIADVDAGIQADHDMNLDPFAGWEALFLGFNCFYGWSQLPYFVYGMADQSGLVDEWHALPPTEQADGGPARSHMLPDGRPVLIVTPDLRFPQGATVEEQRANQGSHFRIITAAEASGSWATWARPDRGTWRWSWYKAGYPWGRDYYEIYNFDQAEMLLAEARLLKAEGLYRTGDLAGAAAIVNETRTAAGLNPTDAAGTNTSCVPRLPDGRCGDLLEMLKWEKRMEIGFRGIAGAGWFFDGRGWGDLWKDTPLQFPVPCSELETLGLTPCPTFGGPGGEMSAPVSTYHFPWEG